MWGIRRRCFARPGRSLDDPSRHGKPGLDMDLCRENVFFHNCAGSRFASSLSLLFSLICGCDRAPAEPDSPAPVHVPSGAEPAEAPSLASGGQPGLPGPARREGTPSQATRCLQPLAEITPPKVSSRTTCPPDPEGRPTMPQGRVSFTEAPSAPELRVELALHFEHQRHGLMFRSQLADDEGMLFSYEDEDVRRFWMHNTCLALDMIHIDKDQYIVGIVENVPPWNDVTRTIDCPAQHVLEVPAGWSRRYGVQPGQRVELSAMAQN